jgi:hypothetical protein
MSSMATLSGPGSGSVSHWSRIEEGEQESRRNSKKYRQREGIFVRTEEEPGNNYGLGYVIIDNLLSSPHVTYPIAQHYGPEAGYLLTPTIQLATSIPDR